jgi:hypothetical protein
MSVRRVLMEEAGMGSYRGAEESDDSSRRSSGKRPLVIRESPKERTEKRKSIAKQKMNCN